MTLLLSNAIPWRTTAWSAGAEDVVSKKSAKRAVKSRKLLVTVLSQKTVPLDLQELESTLRANNNEDGEACGGGLSGWWNSKVNNFSESLAAN